MHNKTVLITGASRGIGKAIALKFAKKGYRVAINCLQNEKMLHQVKTEIELCQTSCFAYVGDVGCYETARDMVLQTKKQLGSIDILINNAGISYIGLFSDMKPEDWEHILRTNLTSVYNLSSLCIPDMVRQKDGKIINISSVWGNAGASCEAAYSATKGGVNALTKALAKELAPSGIQVNAVACGLIDTQMNRFLSDEELLSLTDEIPAGRLGTAEETAEFVYLLAHKNDYLTGQVISLDGGWM